jgi:hypothetical protein
MKKLLLALLACGIILSPGARGQKIIAGVVSPGNYYHDFNPDTSLYFRPIHFSGYPDDTINLVIGSDSNCVLRFSGWGSGGLGGGGGETSVFPQTGDAGFRARADSSACWPGVYVNYDVPDTLEKGDTIEAGQNYVFQTTCYFWTSTYGNLTHPTDFDWVDIGDHYIGFTLRLDQDTLYGWVRVNVSGEGPGYRTTIRDYAFDHDPWTGIRESSFKSNLVLFPNPAHGSITVKHRPQGSSDLLTIQNTTGVAIQCMNGNAEALSVDVSNLKPGLYLMVLTGNHPARVRKFAVY